MFRLHELLGTGLLFQLIISSCIRRPSNLYKLLYLPSVSATYCLLIVLCFSSTSIKLGASMSLIVRAIREVRSLLYYCMISPIFCSSSICSITFHIYLSTELQLELYRKMASSGLASTRIILNKFLEIECSQRFKFLSIETCIAIS